MKDWLIEFGNFKETGNSLTFTGKEDIYIPPDTKEHKIVSSWGRALYAKKLTTGKITAEVEFKDINDSFTYSCLFIFNYINIDNKTKYIQAGIDRPPSNTYSCAYRENNGNGFVNNQWYGDSSNIISNERYKMEMELIGSTLTFSLNGFVIFKRDIRTDFTSNQVGVLCQSTDEIIIHKFNVEPVKRKAFIIMQYEKDYDDLYTNVIAPICGNEFDYDVYREDESYSMGLIIQDINKRISESSIIIADITPDNPNVFYEVGYAHALNKPTILLNEKSKRSRLPFDVSGFRTIFYDNTIGGKVEVERQLRMFLKNINDNIR